QQLADAQDVTAEILSLIGYRPTDISTVRSELPSFNFISSYGVTTVPALPDAFIGDQRISTPDDMLDVEKGPQTKAPGGFAGVSNDYGPAMDNCMHAIDTVISNQPLILPNYNLDGDRTYGW